MPVTNIPDYTKFGLDIEETGGGCSALAGEAMKAAGFTEQNSWEFNHLCPTLGVDILDDASVAAYVADPRTATWPTTPESWNRPLRFYDTGVIANWMVANPEDTLDP